MAFINLASSVFIKIFVIIVANYRVYPYNTCHCLVLYLTLTAILNLSLISIGAGWSSLVARRAHNPKVVGSNPAPATNSINKCELIILYRAFYVMRVLRLS